MSPRLRHSGHLSQDAYVSPRLHHLSSCARDLSPRNRHPSPRIRDLSPSRYSYEYADETLADRTQRERRVELARQQAGLNFSLCGTCNCWLVLAELLVMFILDIWALQRVYKKESRPASTSNLILSARTSNLILSATTSNLRLSPHFFDAR